MRKNWILATALVAISVTAAVGAQSAKGMATPSKGAAMSATYTGCVESVNHGAAFLLTRAVAAESMHGDMDMKHHDDMAMKHDTAMKGDAANSMKHEQAPMADEKMEAMASTSFNLAGSTNLSRHVGQKVSVTGSVSEGSMETVHQDVSTLTIKTLKVISKSCA